MSAHNTELRICSATGIALTPATSGKGWRTTKFSRGPLSPFDRSSGQARASWSRFDTPGRTVYVSSTIECSLAEVLAYYRRKLGSRDSLEKDAAALGLSPKDMAAMVEDEWATQDHMPPGHIPKGWQAQRRVYQLNLPSCGWWIHLEHPESIAAISSAIGVGLASAGVSELDVSVLRGPNRDPTTLIAQWLRTQILDDGSYAHGIE